MPELQPPSGKPPAARPRLWLYAGEPGRIEALRVLATELALMPAAPETVILSEADPARLQADPPTLLVVAGDTLPLALLDAARARGVGLMLVGAGPAPRFDRRSFWPGRMRTVLSGFAVIHARDERAASALRRGLRTTVQLEVTGDLAQWPAVQPCNVSELAALRGDIAARPVWFAYSLPECEFDCVLAAQTEATRQAHRLLLIASPRDSRAGEALAARAAALGLETARRGADDELLETSQVYVADTEDQPGLFLRLAGTTYLGGSLTGGAGSPAPVEAAALGTPLIFGPAALTGPGSSGFLETLARAGGARRIAQGSEMGAAVATLIAPEAGASAALQAWELATRGSAATWAVAQSIRDWLALNSDSGW